MTNSRAIVGRTASNDRQAGHQEFICVSQIDSHPLATSSFPFQPEPRFGEVVLPHCCSCCWRPALDNATGRDLRRRPWPMGEVERLLKEHQQNQELVDKIGSSYYQIIYPVQLRHHEKMGISTREVNQPKVRYRFRGPADANRTRAHTHTNETGPLRTSSPVQEPAAIPDRSSTDPMLIDFFYFTRH
uniref:Uncharacterized protein n=1 Tax=Anopheles atroparvus TaxID=41427 RepID=A0A182JB24_ANOAO